MEGWMTPDIAIEPGIAKEAAVMQLGPPYDDHCSIVDVRDLRVHPQDVIALFVRFVAATKHKSCRIAIVVGQGTAKMQFRRVVNEEIRRDNIEIFEGIERATDWLNKPVAPRA